MSNGSLSALAREEGRTVRERNREKQENGGGSDMSEESRKNAEARIRTRELSQMRSSLSTE